MSESITPLEVLIHRLRGARPPSITVILSQIQDQENYAEFVHIIRGFLPDNEREILGQPGLQAQVSLFASHFEDSYYPLPWHFREGDIDEYSDLVRELPLDAMGFGYQEYDQLVQDGDDSYQLMTYFFKQPYGEDGARVALAEQCINIPVPGEMLERIPGNGYETDEMHRLLDGTKYKALALWGDMIYLSTGNDLLDMDQEMMGNSVPPDWSRENVEYFTDAYKDAELKKQEVANLATKFEDNAAAFFGELLDFIDKRKEKLYGKRANKGADTVPVGHSGNSGHPSG